MMQSVIQKRSYSSVTVYSIDEQVVSTAAQQFADALAQRSEVLAVILFSSLVKVQLGVGSDVDILVVLAHSDRPFLERSPLLYMPDHFPVDLDLFPYTLAEIRGGHPLAREAVGKGRMLWQREGFDLSKISIEEVAE